MNNIMMECYNILVSSLSYIFLLCFVIYGLKALDKSVGELIKQRMENEEKMMKLILLKIESKRKLEEIELSKRQYERKLFIKIMRDCFGDDVLSKYVYDNRGNMNDFSMNNFYEKIDVKLKQLFN